jgi:hypothetical protein
MMAEPRALVDGREEKDQNTLYIKSRSQSQRSTGRGGFGATVKWAVSVVAACLVTMAL